MVQEHATVVFFSPLYTFPWWGNTVQNMHVKDVKRRCDGGARATW